MSKLEAFLARHQRIAVDTSVFIYLFEKNPKYEHLADRVFSWIRAPGNGAVTSTLTLTELLVKAIRDLAPGQVDDFRTLLGYLPNLEWIAPAEEIAALAADFRVRYGFKTPDAIQAATAVNWGATRFVTNDYQLGRIQEIETILLDRLL
jgi:predicted nucleic acid-binding protein